MLIINITDHILNISTLQLSGREDVMEKWILCRLNFAVKECNKGFGSYDFPQVTTAIYNFWLYELCDVFLVSHMDITLMSHDLCFDR